MITNFKEAKYSWLSNMYRVDIIVSDIKYRSVEHAYQSEKIDDPYWKLLCQIVESPYEIKKYLDNLK